MGRFHRVYGEMEEQSDEGWRRIKGKINWKILFKLAAYAALFGVVAGGGLILYVSRDLPDPNKLTQRQVPESTKIYDRTGTHLLYEVFQDQKRTLVDLNNISAFAAKATIAIEDKDFYNHGGIQIKSILRATFNN